MNVNDLHGLWEFAGYVTPEGILPPAPFSAAGQLREFLYFDPGGTFFYAKYPRDASLAWDPEAASLVSADGVVLAHGTWRLDGNRLIESAVVAGDDNPVPNELTLRELSRERLIVVEPTKDGTTIDVLYDSRDVERYAAPPLPPGAEGADVAPTGECTSESLQQRQHAIAALLGQRRFNSAHRLAQQVERACTRAFGPDHPNTAGCLVTLGACASKVGENASAVEALERAHRIYVASVGPNHVLTAGALNNLAPAYRAESRWRDALAAALGATIMRISAFGLADTTATSVQNLGLALSGLGRLDEATEAYQAAAAIFDAARDTARAAHARHNVTMLAEALAADRRFAPRTLAPPLSIDDVPARLDHLMASCSRMLADEPDPSRFAAKYGLAAHAESYRHRITDIRRQQQRADDTSHVDDSLDVLRAAQARLLDNIGTPRRRFVGTLKQVVADALGPKARMALACAFPHFDGSIRLKEERDAMLRSFGIDPVAAHTHADRAREHAAEHGYEIRWVDQRFRRFSGDRNLPRGRYFTVCEDRDGDDRQTLCRELFEYADRRVPGLVFVSDSHDADLMRLLAARGMHRTSGVHFLIVMVVAPPEDAARVAFRHFLAPMLSTLHGPFEAAPELWHGLSLVVVPTVAVPAAIDDVVDLRQRDAQTWLFRFFQHGDGAVSVRSPSRPIADFTDMLPALMYPEYGGSGFTKSLGSWMRVTGVQGLVFPSARSDASVAFGDDGSVEAFRGWNLVDYRGVETLPDAQVHLEDNDWYAFTERGGLTPTLTRTAMSWGITGIEAGWHRTREFMLRLIAGAS